MRWTFSHLGTFKQLANSYSDHSFLNEYDPWNPFLHFYTLKVVDLLSSVIRSWIKQYFLTLWKLFILVKLNSAVIWNIHVFSPQSCESGGKTCILSSYIDLSSDVSSVYRHWSPLPSAEFCDAVRPRKRFIDYQDYPTHQLDLCTTEEIWYQRQGVTSF